MRGGDEENSRPNSGGNSSKMSDDPETPFEEIEMQSAVQLEPLGVHDVADLLHPQYAIVTGGKSKDGCPLITFPDQNNFHALTDTEYQRLMLYLTSVPSLQEADLGFHLIIDRRKDRWNSVKTVLLKISVYFPGLIHVVYVIRPASFLQKALSEVSYKWFKDEFKFRMVVLSTEEELHEHVDASQLTEDLGGSLDYSHNEWIQQRVALEKFSARTHEVSNALDEFTKRISETELPNNVDSTQQLLNQQTQEYSTLKDGILTAAKHGEGLLSTIREKSTTNQDSTFNHSPDTIGNVFTVERLLVQLEETERTFDEFWGQHSTKLRHCLDLRRFEQDFRELQANFDQHLKIVSEMTEIGDTVSRVETLMRETSAFQKLCIADIERGEEVIASGHQLLKIKNSCPLECVEPKCNELMRVRDILTGRLDKRLETLVKCRDLMEQIDKANQWCAKCIDLLASQGIEKCTSSVELAERSLNELQEYLASADEFNLSTAKNFEQIFQESCTLETKALVTQVLQRIYDVNLMCEKRISSLKKVTRRPPRPIQAVTPEPAVPRQPSIGAPIPQKHHQKKKMDSSAGTNSISGESTDATSPDFDPAQDEINKVKQGHVIAELLETERVYVAELAVIIKGYKMEASAKEMQHLLPAGLLEKLDVIFGNIEEIYNFHANMFLKDLENCISSIDLVSLCFVQRRDLFYQLYSYYCQNIPRSEQYRETLAENNQFFLACQRKLGHKLPLAAYLLKPVQRITKYQLLLADLLKYSDESNGSKELQNAVDSMLIVLKCVNDSMLQICITGFPIDLSQQGDLLLQGSFSVWAENKKDIRLRIKPMQRHIFLYQKVMLFCKAPTKSVHNKTNFQFKHYLQMSQIGLTESVKGDVKKFEVWLQGRQEVYTIQATNVDQKQAWVNEIKRVLISQLEELKGEKTKQYSSHTQPHKHLRQTASWETRHNVTNTDAPTRTLSCDDTRSNIEDETLEAVEGSSWSSDCSNSEDEDSGNTPIPSGRHVALADYCAVGSSEVSMREGDIVELLKIGCAGWWFVKVIGTTTEGWAPAAYLESVHRKTSRSSSRSQDRLNDH
ncbi:PREDICTED: guanine nucleotide exchange factor DBS isoform X2 [Nicrophorus vespilloides]|uniref:Guanine nucleotide exchange factor DBS isoform X2 n=1 Tax=Nicrophorus vespilloides TaxID=110193 RepID=A0ABM1MVT2_NICVS|nr:PREDICTED: guanine nucleotide exchange factor DBS isoform X2 [Nicrophorus vespilloides]